MENRIVTAVFKDSAYTKSDNVWQWDYGQILRIQGLKLPTAVEVHFAVSGASESITRIGTTKDGVTDVIIPDSLIETGKNLVAYVYLRDSESGNTEYQIDMVMSKRAKPEAYNTPDDPELFGKTIEAVNKAADRAEKAGQDAVEAAGQAAEDAQQTAEDRKEVAKMVETVSDISEQVKKVEELSNKAQEAATKTGQDAQQTAEDRVEVGKMLETVKDASEQVKNVEESVRKAKESEQAAAGHRTAVEEMKNSVEQTASTFPQTVQSGIRAVENAGASEVREITKAGTSQKAAVEAAGTQAVESVENVKASATEAVETAKTEAVQSVQEEGTTQTGNVTEEGAKQVKAVRDKGNEVLQSIPEDFTTQMETKLNKQQGVENKGKALVIGEDGNVVPEEVASGGGDGIAIINTMSGESPLVIPDSAERVNKRLELGGKTEQVQTTGKNLLDVDAIIDRKGINGSGEVISRTGSCVTDFIFLKPETYTFSLDNKSKDTQIAIYLYNDDKSFNKYLLSNLNETSKIIVDKNMYMIVMFNKEKSIVLNKHVMLEIGSNKTPYEPYTGGKPSPSQEYPQEIKNVGKWNEETRKYEVDVKVTGKNLFDIEKISEKTNWKPHNSFSGYYNFPIFVGKGATVTISIPKKIPTGQGVFLSVCLTDSGDREGWLVHNTNSSLNNTSLTYKAITDYIYLNAHNDTISVFKEKIGKLQVEYGNVATPYRPFKEQTLTLTSDRPITKWDRLIEQDGEIGWLYNSVNETIDGKTGKWSIQPASKIFYRTDITFPIAVPFCIELLGYDYSMGGYKKDTGITINNLGILCITLPEEVELTLDAYKQYLADNPLHVLYKGDSEEFVPLPQSEQNAIRALKTYYPTTVITVDGGELDPDIKVTYTADTKNYIDGKVSAKVASILRQYQADTVNLLSLMPMETQAAMIENDTNRILENVEEMKYE